MLTDLGAVEAATKLEMEAGPSLPTPSALPACLPASVEDKPGLAKVRCFTGFILGSFGENVNLSYISVLISIVIAFNFIEKPIKLDQVNSANLLFGF